MKKDTWFMLLFIVFFAECSKHHDLHRKKTILSETVWKWEKNNDSVVFRFNNDDSSFQYITDTFNLYSTYILDSEDTSKYSIFVNAIIDSKDRKHPIKGHLFFKDNILRMDGITYDQIDLQRIK